MAGEIKEEEKLPVIPDEEMDKPPEGYTQDEWDGLSPGEKDGIKGGIGTPADETPAPEIDEATLKAIAGEEEKAKEEKPGEKKEEVKAEEKPAEVAKPVEEVAKPVEEVKPVEGVQVEENVVITDEDLLRFRPTISEADLPAVDTITPEAQAKFDELDKKLDDAQAEIQTKYDAGDLDHAAYEKEKSNLFKQYQKDIGKINRDITYANIQVRESKKDQLTWDQEQVAFFRAHPEYLDENGNADPILYAALGGAITHLSKSMDHMALLIEADRTVKAKLGISKPKEEKAAVKAPAEENKPVEEKKVDAKPRSPLPTNQTLGDLPQAQAEQVGSAWDALDKLPGPALEKMLEKMTDEQRERYLNSH